MTCVSCSEWFEVWTNVGSPGLCFCPLCGHEFTEAEHKEMNLADADDENEDA